MRRAGGANGLRGEGQGSGARTECRCVDGAGSRQRDAVRTAGRVGGDRERARCRPRRGRRERHQDATGACRYDQATTVRADRERRPGNSRTVDEQVRVTGVGDDERLRRAGGANRLRGEGQGSGARTEHRYVDGAGAGQRDDLRTSGRVVAGNRQRTDRRARRDRRERHRDGAETCRQDYGAGIRTDRERAADDRGCNIQKSVARIGDDERLRSAGDGQHLQCVGEARGAGAENRRAGSVDQQRKLLRRIRQRAIGRLCGERKRACRSRRAKDYSRHVPSVGFTAEIIYLGTGDIGVAGTKAGGHEYIAIVEPRCLMEVPRDGEATRGSPSIGCRIVQFRAGKIAGAEVESTSDQYQAIGQ